MYILLSILHKYLKTQAQRRAFGRARDALLHRKSRPGYTEAHGDDAARGISLLTQAAVNAKDRVVKGRWKPVGAICASCFPCIVLLANAFLGFVSRKS